VVLSNRRRPRVGSLPGADGAPFTNRAFFSRAASTAKRDIDKIAGSNRPPMYRLRIGDLRAVYFVEEQAIFITDIFSKKRDSVYRENL
jgi:mRNA-degrading endonuclease RelE of RelBE toxin-antitoxin system